MTENRQNFSGKISEKIIPVKLRDGNATALILCYPEEEKASRGLFLLLPALGVRAQYYTPFIRELAGQGFHAATADLRGHGYSTVRPSANCDYGYNELLNEDIPAILETANQYRSDIPLYLGGHSLGGQLAALFLAKNPGAAMGMVLITVASPFYKGWKGLSRPGIYTAIHIFKWSSQLIGYFPGHILQFAGKEGKTLMLDWVRVALTNEFKIHNDPFDYNQALLSLNVPVLSITFEDDWMAPESAARNFHLKMPEAKIQHTHITVDESTSFKLDHFDWIKHPQRITGEIAKWQEQIHSPLIIRP